MEENNKIKQLMQLYFGKHFSRYGRILFGRWLKADDAKTGEGRNVAGFVEEISAGGDGFYP